MGAIAGAHVIYVQGYLLIRLNESQSVTEISYDYGM